jgi:hypothetical protein
MLKFFSIASTVDLCVAPIQVWFSSCGNIGNSETNCLGKIRTILTFVTTTRQ